MTTYITVTTYINEIKTIPVTQFETQTKTEIYDEHIPSSVISLNN